MGADGPDGDDLRLSAKQTESRSLGARLRGFRVRAGLSQEALAERAGLGVATLKALERGQRPQPHPHTLGRLAEALGLAAVERDSLLGLARGATAHPTGPDESSAVSAAAASLVRLPVPPTPLIGREADVAEARALLEPTTGAARLLTLLGTGGVGKTRLALAVAASLVEAYTDGVVFVDLAPLHDARLVPATIARSLRVRESRGRSARDLLFEHLRDQQLLLVLDNFEHLLGMAPLLAELLASCTALRLLVTSRSATRVQGERRFAVAPLAAADPQQPLAEIAASPAVQLFVDRAQTVVSGFVLSEGTAADVARICRHLDGLPLAIELAAARVGLLQPGVLVRRLERRLASLTRGAADLPERQQTLRTTLAWSYDLLRPADQALFRRLAVFAGGWTMAAAEAVCADAALPAEAVLDTLQMLVDSSLVDRLDDGRGEPRFGLLETVREFALEQLEACHEAEDPRQRHAAYCLALARVAEPEVYGAGQLAWLERLDREHANLRGALSWYLEREPQAAAELAGRLWQFWRLRGHYTEGLDWLTRAVATAPGQTVAWARAALGAGILARDLGDMATAHTRLTASLERSRALGEPALVAFGLRDLAGWHIHQGAFGPARPLLREALRLARAAGDQRGLAATLMFQAQVAAAGGSSRRAWVLNQAGLAAARQAGDRWLIAAILLQLGSLAVDAGDPQSAVPLLEEGLEVSRVLGVPTRAGQFQWQLGRIALAQGELERALPLLEALRVAARERQSPRGSAAALVDLARVAQVRGARTEARALLREALRLREAVSDRLGSIECLEQLAAVDAGVNPLHAGWLLGAAAAGRRVLGAPPSPPMHQALVETARTAQAAASAAAFEAAQVTGELVPLEQAIVQALQEGPATPTAPAATQT